MAARERERVVRSLEGETLGLWDLGFVSTAEQSVEALEAEKRERKEQNQR